MKELVTAAELAPMFRRSAHTILQWKRDGKITADIDTGHTILFDAEKVRKQLEKQSRKTKIKETPVPFGMVMTY